MFLIIFESPFLKKIVNIIYYYAVYAVFMRGFENQFPIEARMKNA